MTAGTWAQLRQMVFGYRQTAVLHAALRIGLLDAVEARPRQRRELSELLQIPLERLVVLIDVAVMLGALETEPDGAVGLTELGRTCRAHPVRDILLVAGGLSAPSYTHLVDVLRTGTAGARSAFADGFYPHLDAGGSAVEAEAYHAAISTPHLTEAVISCHDFRDVSVVDVGGGRGELLRAILERNPTAHGWLIETPAAATQAAEGLAHLASRCTVVSDPQCRQLPAGADVYVMMRVLATMNDATATATLRRCRDAMTDHSRLLVVEMVLDRAPTSPEAAIGALDLLVHFGGGLRTAEQWEALLSSGGMVVARRTSLAPAGAPGWFLIVARRSE